MSNPNAGKIMMAKQVYDAESETWSTPDIIFGVDGEVVFADDLYQMTVPFSTSTKWWRKSDDLLDASPYDNPIYDADWSTLSPPAYAQYSYTKRTIDDVHYHDFLMGHLVQKYVIDWDSFDHRTRVDKIKIHWSVIAASPSNNDITTPPVWSLDIGNEDATTPSGSNEPWDNTGWSNVTTCHGDPENNWSSGKVFATGKTTLTRANNSFYVALYGIGYVGGSLFDPMGFDASRYYHMARFAVSKIEVIYNLKELE